MRSGRDVCILVKVVVRVCYGKFDLIFFFKPKTAYEVRISDWSSGVCSSDLIAVVLAEAGATVVIADRDEEGARRQAEALIEAGHNAGAVAIELADERSEEHTSELQSLMRISYAVFCLKKKNIN